MKKTILLSVLLSCVMALGASAANWPAFRGPNANGISPETGINKNWKQKPPQMLWKINMSDDGFSGPSVANGILYVIDHRGSNDVVRAVNMSTGKGVWQYTFAEPGGSNYGYSRATPVISGGKVYIVNRSGILLCLDAKTGKKAWSMNMVQKFGGRKPTWDYAWSPIVDGNKLIILPGGPNAAVVALNASTGALIWRGGGSNTSGYATPVKATINGKVQYVAFTATHVIGVNAANGALLWSYAWKTDHDVNAATPVVIGNKVFITSGYGRGCAMLEIGANNKAKLLWKNSEIQSHFSSPIASNGYIYSTTDPGDMVCLSVANGKRMWRQSGFEKGGICGVDGTIIACNGSGGNTIMMKMASGSYQELGRFNPLGGQSWTAPIVADKKLILRNKNTLACFTL